MAGALNEIWASGSWVGRTCVAEYRCEWLGEKLIERITFAQPVSACVDAELLLPLPWTDLMGDVVRFWLVGDNQVVDKAFDASGEATGYFSPVTRPLVRDGDGLSAKSLGLGLSIDTDQRVTVTGEAEFDAAIASGALTPVEIEHAEHRIRQLTTAAAAGTWPPAFVRNFSILSSIDPKELNPKDLDPKETNSKDIGLEGANH